MLQVKSLIYVGIDPGSRRCGIGAVTYGKGELVYYIYLENWTPEELYSILRQLNTDWTIHKIGIENVHTMPGQGGVSTGKFMKATGIIIGTVNAMRFPYIEITPQKWKKLSPILAGEKGETKTKKKAKSLAYIAEKYPDCELLTMKARKDAKIDMADAVCIATYMYENEM